MVSPKRRVNVAIPADRGSLTRGRVQGCLLSLTLWCLFLVLQRSSPGTHFNLFRRSSHPGPPVFLFIAIGSAPGNSALRHAIRSTWLTWVPDDSSVTYKFFSDARPAHVDDASRAMWDALRAEAATHGDVVLQPLRTGYGSSADNAYGQRARYQLRWAARAFAAQAFFLRVDDDSFLCLHRLLYELRSAPVAQFFWGRYWCRAGRSRADENFMLFSGDVAAFLAHDAYLGRIVPFDESVTMGWNFGLLAWTLNLSVFDDQGRIDAQQGYLTEYMHEETGDRVEEDFCEKFMYAHHVGPAVLAAAFEKTVPRVMYALPERTSPRETCPGEGLSFIPARHSDALPNLEIKIPR